MKKFLPVAAALLFAAESLFAIPAMPGATRVVTQPDGSQLTLRIVGDERAHCYTTTDLVPVILDAEGRYCYATLDLNGRAIASDMAARDPETRTTLERTFVGSLNASAVGETIFSQAMKSPRAEAIKATRAAAARKLQASAAAVESDNENKSEGIGLNGALFPHMGDVHSLVVLVDYSDVKFSMANPQQYFNNMLNQEGFSQHNGQGSARDYFRTVSDDQFRPTFDVYGPATMPNRRSYYGGNDLWGYDVAAEEMVAKACEMLDSQINFANYDLDGDGYVDNVYVIYAGQGEASYGPAESIWPHQFELHYQYHAVSLDGVLVDHYGCCNEYDEVRPSGIGTFCHEFGHVMGLPDLYTTTYSASTMYLTPGEWDVMDHGSYNNDSRTPAGYSIYERNALSWIKPIVLSKPDAITLTNIEENNTGAIALTSNKNEFFLFENRQQIGWDKYIPYHGMLVWHIDFNKNVWEDNSVNDSAHQYVDIEEAGGRANNESVAYMREYPFPGTQRKTEFTDETKPNMLTWGGASLGLPITNIKEEDGVITFDVAGGYIELTAPVAKFTDINPGGFTISWDPIEKATLYTLSIYSLDDRGNKVFAKGFEEFETPATSVTVTRLNAETTYYAELASHRSQFHSEVSAATPVTTGERDFAYIVPQASQPTEVSATGFNAVWEPIADADSYELNVKGLYDLDADTETADFGSKLSKLTLPEGWECTGGIYTSTNYFGESAPAVRFNEHRMYLMTKVYDNDITAISFWCRNASSANSLDIEVRADGNADTPWILLEALGDIPANKTGLTYTNHDVPAGMHQVRISFNKSATNGQIALDDVSITTGGEVFQDVPGYEALNVGAGTSHYVTLPTVQTQSATISTPAKQFYYTVTGVNATGKTLASDPMAVIGNGSSAITDVELGSEAAAQSELFTLQGTRVAGTPAPGIYIMRQGTRTSKIVIK